MTRRAIAAAALLVGAAFGAVGAMGSVAPDAALHAGAPPPPPPPDDPNPYTWDP